MSLTRRLNMSALWYIFYSLLENKAMFVMIDTVTMPTLVEPKQYFKLTNGIRMFMVRLGHVH